MFYSNLGPKTHRFWGIRLQICRDLETRVRGHSRSSELTRIDPPHMTSYWRSIATMDLSRTVMEINGDFSQKSQFFPPRVLCATAEGVPRRKWVSALRVKKLEWWGYQAEQKVSRYLQPCGYNTPTRQTDGRTDTGLTALTCSGNNRYDISTLCMTWWFLANNIGL